MRDAPSGRRRARAIPWSSERWPLAAAGFLTPLDASLICEWPFFDEARAEWPFIFLAFDDLGGFKIWLIARISSTLGIACHPATECSMARHARSLWERDSKLSS